MLPIFRSQYGYDVKEASDASAIPTVGESLTVQSQTEDTDLNLLMYRYGVTGQFPDFPKNLQYGDFTQVTDFRSALEAVRRAQDLFLEYPANFRARFENNPQLFLDFCENPANINEMRSLGMFKEVQNVSVGGGTGQSNKGTSPGGGGSSQQTGQVGSAESGAQPGGQTGQARSTAVV